VAFKSNSDWLFGQLNWYLDKAYAQFQQRKKVVGGAKGHDRNTGMAALA
jgi:hypothetical protein